jgi:putative heme-binding domain-containing protein
VLVNGYETFAVTTTGGEIHMGLFSQQTADAVYLHSVAGQVRIRIACQEIAEMAPSKISSMPSGLDQALPVEDPRDLVAYLQSLK